MLRTTAVALLLVTVACDPDPTEGDAPPSAGKTATVAGEPAATVAGKPPAAVAGEPAAAVAGEPAATRDPAAPPVTEDVRPTAPSDAAAREVRAAFSRCLIGCEDGKMTHAVRAACRYNCEKSDAPAADGALVDSDPVEYVVSCMGRCYTGGKRSETCTSACKSAVAALPATPSAAVLDRLGTCIDACHAGKHLSETDRATCGLNCTQVARVAGPAQP